MKFNETTFRDYFTKETKMAANHDLSNVMFASQNASQNAVAQKKKQMQAVHGEMSHPRFSIKITLTNKVNFMLITVTL